VGKYQWAAEPLARLPKLKHGKVGDEPVAIATSYGSYSPYPRSNVHDTLPHQQGLL
jgi:hypothetical protein